MINAGPSLIVLAMLRERARYGYDIAKELQRMSEGRLVFQQGTLYPLLNRLQKDGLIRGEWEAPEGESSRRIYHLTDKGQAEVERQIDAWHEYVNAIGHVLKETAGETA